MTTTDAGAIEAPSATGGNALERRPVYYTLPAEQIGLLKSMSGDINDMELAAGLQLAHAYRLDPYAREIWFTKSRGRDGRQGKLLIMVGRDGLRKIANRNGLEVTGDKVHAKDEFVVELIEGSADAKPGEWAEHGSAPFHRVTHKRRGFGEARGAIVGAWCRVWERRSRVERGYFDADVAEYDQAGRDQYSPWNKQKSAMMLGAVERQAIRQATPLGGLLAEGEDVFVDSTAEEVVRVQASLEERVGSWAPSDELARQATDLIERARATGHVGLSDAANAEMSLKGQDADAWVDWITQATQELAAHEAREAEAVPEAEVVAEPTPGDVGDDRAFEPGAEPTLPPAGAEAALEGLRARAQDVGDRIDAAVAEERFEEAEQLGVELDQLNEAIAAAAPGDDQAPEGDAPPELPL